MKAMRFTGRRIKDMSQPLTKGRRAMSSLRAVCLKSLHVKEWFKRICPIFISLLLKAPDTHGHYSGDQNKKNEMGWSHSTYGEVAFMVFVGKHEGRRPLGRPRRRREDNIKMDLQEVG